jgi:hypothetical protein
MDQNTLKIHPIAIAAAMLASFTATVAPVLAAEAPPQTLIYGLNLGAKRIHAGDFNGDGKTDFAILLLDKSEIGIWLGDGKGGYRQKARLQIGRGGQYTLLDYAVADVNGDGHPDLITLRDDGQPAIETYLNDGKGRFTKSQTQLYKTAGDPSDSALQVADLNGDGHPDVVVASNGYTDHNGALHDPTHYVFLGNGNTGVNAPIENTLCPNGDSCYSFALGDFNKDGKADIVISDYSYSASSTSLRVFLSNGNGGFTAGVTIPDVGLMYVADLNGDGVSDIVGGVASSDGSRNVVSLLGDGNGGFGNGKVTGIGPAVYGGSPCIYYGNTELMVLGDFNGDHRPDLFFATVVGGTPDDSSTKTGVFSPQVALTYRPGDGTGGFGSPVALTTVQGAFLSDVVAVDANKDGKDDALVLAQSKKLFGFRQVSYECENVSYRYVGLGAGSVWQVDGQ